MPHYELSPLLVGPISIIVTALVAGGTAALKPMTEQIVMESSLD